METQIQVTREAAYLHKVLRLAQDVFGIESQDRQHMINELLPYQESEGELLIRPRTLAEDDFMCMLNGLAIHMDINQHRDPPMVGFFLNLLPGFKNGFFTFLANEIEGLNTIGYRRYKNQVWWVHREPTAEEQAVMTLLKGKPH